MPARRRKDAFLLLCALHMVSLLLVAIPRWVNAHAPEEQWPMGLLIGVTFGSVTLSAVWSAMGKLLDPARVAMGLLWSVAACAALFWQMTYDQAGLSQAIDLSVAMLTLFGGVQAIVWTLRLAGRLRLLLPEDNCFFHFSGPQDWQLTLGRLLAWTLIATLAFAGGRALADDGVENWLFPVNVSALVPFVLLTSISGLLSLPLMLGLLRAKTWRGCVALAGVSLAGLALAAALQDSLFRQLFGAKEISQASLYFWVNASLLVWVGLSLGVIRWQGYRLLSAQETTIQWSASRAEVIWITPGQQLVTLNPHRPAATSRWGEIAL